MNTISHEDHKENLVRERAMEALQDRSMPATQVIQEQDIESEENNTPRFIP